MSPNMSPLFMSRQYYDTIDFDTEEGIDLLMTRIVFRLFVESVLVQSCRFFRSSFPDPCPLFMNDQAYLFLVLVLSPR